eukprot:2246881-Amphidinium_carterae.1
MEKCRCCSDGSAPIRGLLLKSREHHMKVPNDFKSSSQRNHVLDLQDISEMKKRCKCKWRFQSPLA